MLPPHQVQVKRRVSGVMTEWKHFTAADICGKEERPACHDKDRDSEKVCHVTKSCNHCTKFREREESRCHECMADISPLPAPRFWDETEAWKVLGRNRGMKGFGMKQRYERFWDDTEVWEGLGWNRGMIGFGMVCVGESVLWERKSAPSLYWQNEQAVNLDSLSQQMWTMYRSCTTYRSCLSLFSNQW